MFNLYQILTGAQGGQALDNLAARFGLTREQADSAVKALIPALSTAFMTKAMHPGGIQEIAGAMSDDHHRQAYADPGIAAAPETQDKGGAIAGSIFGNQAMADTVVREAARYTGLSEVTLQRMLPVVVSILVGGVTTAMHNQGVGGWLSQIANSGLGNLFGQGAGGLGAGGLGSIIGGMFGGAKPQGAQPAASQSAGATPPPPGMSPSGTSPSGFPGAAWGGGLPPAMQAGMEAFGKMFQSGVPGGLPGQMGNLGDQISSILSGKRG